MEALGKASSLLGQIFSLPSKQTDPDTSGTDNSSDTPPLLVREEQESQESQLQDLMRLPLETLHANMKSILYRRMRKAAMQFKNPLNIVDSEQLTNYLDLAICNVINPFLDSSLYAMPLLKGFLERCKAQNKNGLPILEKLSPIMDELGKSVRFRILRLHQEIGSLETLAELPGVSDLIKHILFLNDIRKQSDEILKFIFFKSMGNYHIGSQYECGKQLKTPFSIKLENKKLYIPYEGDNGIKRCINPSGTIIYSKILLGFKNFLDSQPPSDMDEFLNQLLSKIIDLIPIGQRPHSKSELPGHLKQFSDLMAKPKSISEQQAITEDLAKFAASLSLLGEEKKRAIDEKQQQLLFIHRLQSCFRTCPVLQILPLLTVNTSSAAGILQQQILEPLKAHSEFKCTTSQSRSSFVQVEWNHEKRVMEISLYRKFDISWTPNLPPGGKAQDIRTLNVGSFSTRWKVDLTFQPDHFGRNLDASFEMISVELNKSDCEIDIPDYVHYNLIALLQKCGEKAQEMRKFH